MENMRVQSTGVHAASSSDSMQRFDLCTGATVSVLRHPNHLSAEGLWQAQLTFEVTYALPAYTPDHHVGRAAESISQDILQHFRRQSQDRTYVVDSNDNGIFRP